MNAEEKVKAIEEAFERFRKDTSVMCNRLYSVTQDGMNGEDDLAEANELWNEYLNNMEGALLLKLCLILSNN